MEYLDVVDENDVVIGRAARDECHRNKKLIHRGANVYIFNSEKLVNILRVKRSMAADTEPGKWTILIGEHNKIGEDYDAAIQRGLREELGIKNIVCRKISKVLQRMKNQTECHQNYIGIYKGNVNAFKLDKAEIEQAEFIKFADLLKDVKENREKYMSYIDSALGVILPHMPA